MKKLTAILLAILMLIPIIASCGGHDETTTTETPTTEAPTTETPTTTPPVEPSSEGLAFEINSDGKSYTMVGIGECKDTVIHIPDEYNGFPVTSIGFKAFYYNKQITHVYIPNSVTYIDADVFFCCSNLTTVVIPDTVTYIGEGTFLGCKKLTDIKLPANLTAISEMLFRECGIESITIPDSVTSIDSHAFRDCKKLENIIIPSSVTNISKNAFYNNENLTVYCEATSKPDGWDDEWTGDERKDIKVKEVVWGYKAEE